jgi:hypothetical protein
MNIAHIAYKIALFLVVTSSELNGFGETFLTDGLVAYYPFNGNANDESGHGNGAMAQGALLATNRFGVALNSYAFANGAYLETTNSTGFPISNDDFTISIWLSFSAPFTPTGSGVETIFVNGAIDQFQLALNPVDGTNGFMDFWTGGEHGAPADCRASTMPWGVNKWHSVMVRRSNNVITIYRDGFSIGQGTTAFGNNAGEGNRNLVFGYRKSPQPCCPFTGQLDDIRIYSRALSEVEIVQLFSYEKQAPRDLVSQWRAESNANDEVDGNNGTLKNGAGVATGQVGHAFNFNGVNQYLEIPNSSNLNPASSFSIEGWIFPKQDGIQSVMSKWTDSTIQPNQRSYAFALVPNWALRFAISDVAHQLDVSFANFDTPSNVIRLNIWSHVAAVYDQPSGSRRVYVNGVKVAERIDTPINMLNGTAKVAIGAQLTAGSAQYFFNGLIDELSFYSKALNSDEIQVRYAAGNPAPRQATATAQVINGLLMAITITDPGYGYTNAPVIEITGGGGHGATAVSSISNGIVTSITLTDAGSGYTMAPEVLVASPAFTPWLDIAISQVRVSQHVVLGRKYILESSMDLNTWVPVGAPFIAHSEVIDQVFDVDATGRYFRIRETP